MNLAILIGISEYEFENQLPACINDVELLKNLLDATKKYDDILYIKENTKANQVNEAIINFVETHKGKEIEELFFYYTGHGCFIEEEFFFLCSNFQIQRKHTTAIGNSELDQILRNLQPELFTKVIDSCQSGISYVKSSNEKEYIKSYLEKAKDQAFKKCFFMFSSLSSQFSWQDENLSLFTKSFVNSIITHPNHSIRYRDITGYIADDLAATDMDQTPFFVNQAELTEIFCTISEEMRKNIKLEQTPIASPPKGLSLTDLIISDAGNYCTSQEVEERLSIIKKEVENFQLHDELEQLFFKNTQFNTSLNSVPNIEFVANSLEKQESNYFINLLRRRVEPDNRKMDELEKRRAELEKKRILLEKKRAQPELRRLYDVELASLERTEKRLSLTRIGEFIIDFKHSVPVPFTSITIELNPNFENISQYKCVITYVFSKVDIKFYYFFIKGTEKSWGNFVIEDNDIQWKENEVKLKNLEQFTSCIRVLLQDFHNFVYQSLARQFNFINPATPSKVAEKEIKEMEEQTVEI
ncbi:hypothetical protein COI69_29120 [Bacillus cereus]|uniref:Peptidase C14 caspase domain-containing protein n=1 Tax=Bacillus cereus TaxID=1396 RepID=A0A9X7E186_BACCE|nr:caspase family protein [Bacillus cereus]PHA25576.1 hypothetical protein COE70_03395 [Bacillus cereus]PHG74886.1 hypothetical protein COI69_29120 [Bacillus cereus]